MTLFHADYQPGLRPQAEDWTVYLLGRQVLLDRQTQQPLIPYQPSMPFDDVFHMHIGHWRSRPCFAYFLPEAGKPAFDERRFQPVALRAQLGVFDDETFCLVGRAAQLAHWSQRHKYCGRCGYRAQLHEAELAFVCAKCEEHFYPAIAPCVMGLVVKGDTCLLAHNTRFPEGFYSVVAGFIEAGETAERALLREIREETGVVARNPTYISSQPWPFPSQLMLGYIAEYAGGEICADGKEISDAQWFGRNDLPARPPAETLSGRLIELFQNGYTAG